MNAKTTFRHARHLWRLADADPGYSFDNRVTRSGRNPLAHGHVNPTRDRAVAEAYKLDPRCAALLLRRMEAPMDSTLRARFHADNPRMKEVVGGKWVDAGHPHRRHALAQLRAGLLTFRSAMKGRLYPFATGYGLLDAKAKRIAATSASHEAQAKMLAVAEECVSATNSAVAAWRQAVAA